MKGCLSEKSVVENYSTHLYTNNNINNQQIMSDDKKKKYKVKLAEGKEEGVYANAASVHFNSNECVVDMAYVIPNATEPILKVVSRVNMSHKTAESFLKVLSNAILDWKNKSKE